MLMSWQYSGGVSRGGDPYDTAEPEPSDDVEDYDTYVESDANHWRWVAGVAAAVLLIAVVGTVVIVNGGDSASTAGRIVPSATLPAFSPAPPKPPSPSLPSETVTTRAPSTSTAEAAPPTQSVPPSESAAPPPPQVGSRTIVYTVSGSKQPFDPVTVTYTDETGALRTDFDVTLPWTKTLTVNAASVLLNSVTAVSFASHLNCTITDANGQTVASQNYNTIATTCNR
jgi:hypothetical protein